MIDSSISDQSPKNCQENSYKVKETQSEKKLINSVRNMKTLILILKLASIAVAYEKIFAINAGGDAHTDLDGIVYEGDVSTNSAAWIGIMEFDFGNVSKSEKSIYQRVSRSNDPTLPVKFDIPLKSDGLYVLIAKFSYGSPGVEELQNITLNDDIKLQSKVDLAKLCGGKKKICDQYFQFCVSDKKLYYQHQLTLVQDDEIHVEISPVKSWANIAGLVLLKVTYGERHILKSSATNESLEFDPMKMNPNCITTACMTINEHQKNHQRQNIKMDDSLNNLTLAEVLNQQFFKINTSIERNYESNNQFFTQQAHTFNQSTEKMNIKFENLQSDFTTITKQVNNNFETLQFDVEQLVESQQRFDKMALDIQAEHARLKLQILGMNYKLTKIHNLLLKSLGNTEKNIADTE
jgi:Malectin domain